MASRSQSPPPRIGVPQLSLQESDYRWPPMASSWDTLSYELDEMENIMLSLSQIDGSMASPAALDRSAISIPIDCHPSEQSLIQAHLRPWVASSSGHRKAGFIHVADPYTAVPADLTGSSPPAVAQDGERAWYFLTRLRHRGGRRRLVARTVAGGGSWHGDARPRAVFLELERRRQVGWRQHFSFKNHKGIRTGWIMSELRLYDDPEREGEGEISVLCKVYRSSRKPSGGSTLTLADSDISGAATQGEANGDADSAETSSAARKRKHVAASKSDPSDSIALSKDKDLNDFSMPKESVHRGKKGGGPGGKVENRKIRVVTTQEELTVRRGEALVKKRAQEMKIMLQDTSKLDEKQKEYVELMRAEILASKRRGSGDGDDNTSV